jgi:outer membrane lipoprotein-sorting protein
MMTSGYRYALTLLFLTAGALNALSQDAAEILNSMDKIIFSPKDRQGKISIILIDKSGKEKIREAVMFQKGNDKKLYRYTKPESQAGIATLSLPGDEMWLYLPAFGKPKKISNTDEKQSFNNTDFSYEDMIPAPYAERYTPELLGTENDLYILNLVPKTGKSDYSKIIARVNKEHGYPLSMEYFDLKGRKTKEATYVYERAGKYWNASEVVMKDLVKVHSTKILLSEMKYDQGLSDDLFLVENMKPAGGKKGVANE